MYKPVTKGVFLPTESDQVPKISCPINTPYIKTVILSWLKLIVVFRSSAICGIEGAYMSEPTPIRHAIVAR